MQTDAPHRPALSGRLQSVDFLRGAAALAVVFNHTIHFGDAHLPQAAWFQAVYVALSHGYLGVPLFFVISGFCIHGPWAKRYAATGQSKLEFKTFWKRRLHRLYPPYFVMLCISMALMFISYRHGGAGLYPEPKLRWMGMDFVAHLFMLHGFHPIFDSGGGNPPFWTLAREEYFYILYLGLLFCRRTRGLLLTVLGVLLVGWAFEGLMWLFLPREAALPADSPWLGWWHLIHGSAFVLWIQWCLGMVAVESHYGLVKLPRWCRALWAVPVWGALALLSLETLPIFSSLLWGLTFFTLINYCVRLERKEKWPRHAFMAWMSGVGVFSYSLYLVHNPAMRIVEQLVKAPAATATSPWIYLAYELFLVACCFGAGKLFFWLVERHFLNTKAPSASPTIELSPIAAKTA